MLFCIALASYFTFAGWLAVRWWLDYANLLRPGFVAFDAIKAALQDENGKISGPRTVVAGFGAGFTESLLAVTPFESIKTQLYVLFLLS